jgi:HK97 family phage major capsid protein
MVKDNKAAKAELREILSQMEEVRSKDKPTEKDVQTLQGLLVRAKALDADIFMNEKGQPVDNGQGIGGELFGSVRASSVTYGVTGAKSIRDVFGKEHRSYGSQDIGSIPEMMALVKQGRDSRLFDVRGAASEGVPSEGGFLTPSQLSDVFYDDIISGSEVMPYAKMYPMKSDTIDVPAFKASDMSSGGAGVAGGVKAYWSGENSTLTPQEAGFRSMKLTANKLTIFSLSSNELKDDSPGFEVALGSVMNAAALHKLESCFINGTGAGQPLGMANAPCTITISGETGQSADTINAMNIKKMYSRLLPGSHKRARWYVSATCLPELLSIGQSIGTAGAFVPWASFGADGVLRMLNCPVIVSEHCAAIGDLGQILLADVSYYGIGLRQELRIDSSNDYAFNSDQKAYRLKARLDAQPLLDKAYTPEKGLSLSPFIKLAAI